ncbi:MAG: bifunctional proline dehydrogenase/L-glutamate gamma-semialdehyde dehydrogenase [Beutenbergiaceae bacterium]
MLTTTVTDVVEEAVALGYRWVEQTSHHQRSAERRTTGRLARLVAEPAGLDFVVKFLDRVARPQDAAVAARALRALAGHAGAKSVLSASDRAMLGLGSRVAGAAPEAVLALVRRRLRQLVGHLVVDATDVSLGKILEQARTEGYRLNLSLLGEAVLGDAQADLQAERITALTTRADVEHISVKLSALTPQISPWDTADTTKRALARLRPLALTANSMLPATALTLDMEGFGDLEPTVSVFEALLADPELGAAELGIAVQAYLPESPELLQRLIGAAQRRVDAGGAPAKIRIVKGANLAMERVEAQLHGWPSAPFSTKAEVDANYQRLLDVALRPEVTAAARIGLATHNVFDIAAGYLLARRRGVGTALDIELLHGMAPAQVRAIRAEVGATSPMILYTPVAARDDFDVATAYLIRRLQENAAQENFLHALVGGTAAVAEQESRFRAAAQEASSSVPSPRRVGQRAAIGPQFANTVDSDPSVAAIRDLAAELVARAPVDPVAPELTDTDDVDIAVEIAVGAAAAWQSRAGSERAKVLRAIAVELEAARPDLIASMAAEAGKSVGEADREVSEAVDFARYYAEQAVALDDLALAEGLQAQPGEVVLVAPPWNFPVAIGVGGALAALAAGSAAILKPAPQTPRCAEVAIEAVRAGLQECGAEPDLVQVVRTDEGPVGKALVSHPDVATVLLTGSTQTAQRFSRWRVHRSAGPRVFAETSGKNAIVVTPSSDFDQAIADVVRSAFGHAGQKCSAASLLILVGSVANSERFLGQLIDAVSSVRVGWPSNLGAMMGPLIEPAQGKLADALQQLQPGESWLVQPSQLDTSGRLWSPGLKTGVLPGSGFHLTECFGPVLGIMAARDLNEAIGWQNATGYGLTGALHSLDEAEIASWSDAVEVGNAYINRHTTGAIVRRQPFGGWQRSVFGPGAKVGGPHYLPQLIGWQQAGTPTALGQVGPRVAAILAATQAWLPESDWQWLVDAAGSDAHARDIYAVAADTTGLPAESNVLRLRPLTGMRLRAAADASAAAVLRVLLAAECAGVPVEVSIDPGLHLPDPMAAWVADQGWAVESDDAVASRIAEGTLRGRIRVIGEASQLWSASIEPKANVTLLVGEVLTSGKRELLTMVREQVVSQTRHRYGHLVGA